MHWAALGFRKKLVNRKSHKTVPTFTSLGARQRQCASAGAGTTKFRACGAQGFKTKHLFLEILATTKAAKTKKIAALLLLACLLFNSPTQGQ
jgi:hypothetical protein